MELCTSPDHHSRGRESTARWLDSPLGMADEHAELDRLFRSATEGRGQAIVVRGSEGLGKSTLLEHAIGSASGCCVVRVAGLQSERDLAFAGLHRLCAPMLDRLDRLPAPQADALAAGFGFRPGGVDVLFVGLAVLGLFADVSADQPLVCAVDDADLLDEPSRRVLAVVARRLRSERIALVFTVTEPPEDLAGLPELVLRPLADAAARELLASVIPGPFDARVRDRIVVEAGGNRRALVGFAGGAAEQLAGGFGLPPAPTATGTTVRALRERLESLPAQSRRFLLVAAAEPEGDAARVRRAAAELDIDAASADEATSLGLCHLGRQVTFRDAQMRSVVYHDAPADERRRVHRALADSCDPEPRRLHRALADAGDPERDPDRRVWHRALAALAPDEALASALECAASRVAGRGGVAASAAFLERAALLTPERSDRARRALAAARAKYETGSIAGASDLVSVASQEPHDGQDHARMALLKAQLAFASHHRDAGEFLLDAVRALERVDARLVRGTYLEALEAAITAGRPELAGVVAGAAARAAGAIPVGSPAVADLLLDGLGQLYRRGHAAAVPTLRRAVAAALAMDEPRWLGLASRAAGVLGDHDAARTLVSRCVRVAREAGAQIRLLHALDHLAILHVHAGDLEPAAGVLEEARRLSDVTGHAPATAASLVLAAWQGTEVEPGLSRVRRLDRPISDDRHPVSHAAHATAALLHAGLGHHGDALSAARRACEPDDPMAPWVLAELVEAAARTGRREVAAAAFERLAEWTRLAGTEWARGIEARARAVVSEGDKAEKNYRTAIERFGRCRAVPDRARAHLLYGEWLRRERRRRDARVELRVAYELFAGMGAAGFAARADDELLATGERARRRTVEAADELTPREAQVAQLARDGRSNPQIGAELFISARTVEYHLRKVFAKLGIESRGQLGHALAG
jgi:DNA-binding CsgD family transcriptional regulator